MSPKTILITGATSGIGRHAALHLAARGHRVIATGRREGALAELAREAGALDLHPLRLDVTDAASIAAAVDAVDALTEGHGLDALVNNAGYGQGGPVLEVDDAAVRRQYDTNVFGLLAVTRAFAPKMIERGAGRILNVSSIGGRATLPLLGVYNSTKYAVESLSDALRMELAPFGVQVVLIEPGGIDTNFNATVVDSLEGQERMYTGPWAAVAAEVDAITARFEAFAPGPLVISQVMTRAIEGRRPRARYVAPFKDAMMLRALTALPTRLVDWALSRLFGLHLIGRPSAQLPERAAA